jgi:hypothetical protein
MVICTRCDRLIDSDDDPECFTKRGDGPIVCECCREDNEESEE